MRHAPSKQNPGTAVFPTIVAPAPSARSTATASLAGRTSSIGPTIRAATPAGTLPWVYRYRQASSPSAPAGGRASEPSGDISVIPQAWMISTPYRSWNACISAGGQAEPPTMTSCSEDRSADCLSR